MSPATLAANTEAVARWMVACKWSFSEKGPEYGYGGPGCEVRTERAQWTTEDRDRSLGLPRFSEQIESIGQWLTGPPFAVYQGSAYDLMPPEDASEWVAYLDPPYSNTTGYKNVFPREQVIEVAQRWAKAGALVCISEAVPIQIEGWHHVQIDHARRGSKRTFGSTEEWLTLNREPANRIGKQIPLF